MSTQGGAWSSAAAGAAPAAPAKRSSAPAADESPTKRARLQLESPTKKAQLDLQALPPPAAAAQSAAAQPPDGVQQPASLLHQPAGAQPQAAALPAAPPDVTPFLRPYNNGSLESASQQGGGSQQGRGSQGQHSSQQLQRTKGPAGRSATGMDTVPETPAGTLIVSHAMCSMQETIDFSYCHQAFV